MPWTKITKAAANEGYLEGTGYLAGDGYLVAENVWTKITKQRDEILGYGLGLYGLEPYGSPPGSSMWTKLTKATP